MVQYFASAIAKYEVSQSWITRFLHCYADQLTIKGSAGIDCNRHAAASYKRYKLYFDLLHSKMQEYDVQPEDTYNMNKKGFFVGITTHSNRVFSKAIWQAKECTAAIQDGSREWITAVTCVCASEEVLPLAIIYEGIAELLLSWVNNNDVAEHKVFFSHLSSGWKNNDLGLAWFTQIFDCFIKKQLRWRWQLPILNSHGSHITASFIGFCDANKILLAVFLPYATHSLQPLNVVLFSPLLFNYLRELDRHLHQSQELIGVKKGSFFPTF
jgi:hypothetical protein